MMTNKLTPMEHADFVFNLVSNRRTADQFSTRQQAQDFADGIKESTVWALNDRGTAWVVRVGPWMYAAGIRARPKVTFSVSPRTSTRKEHTRIVWTPAILARLGREKDMSIAQDLGCTTVSVAAKRRQLNIPALAADNGAKQWTEYEDNYIGLDYDHKIASRLGVSTEAVRKRRVALGIASVGVSKKHKTPAMGYT